MKRRLLAHPRRTHFKFDQCLLQVHWVQCDKCELWYHLFCIGLKPHNIKEDEDFCCRYCITTTCQCDFTSLLCCRNCKDPSGKAGKTGSGSDMDTD